MRDAVIIHPPADDDTGRPGLTALVDSAFAVAPGAASGGALGGLLLGSAVVTEYRVFRDFLFTFAAGFHNITLFLNAQNDRHIHVYKLSFAGVFFTQIFDLFSKVFNL